MSPLCRGERARAASKCGGLISWPPPSISPAEKGSCKMSSVRITAGAGVPQSHAMPVVAPISEPWFRHRVRWALSLPQGVHVVLCVMTAWACLGISCGAIALAADPHGPALTCALALLFGAMFAWAALMGAACVEDELGMRGTAPLFVLLTIVALLMSAALTGTHRVWLAVLASLQCVSLLVAFSPFASTRRSRDFGWRALKRVGASGSAKYGDWRLALRWRLQAPFPARCTPRLPLAHASASTPQSAHVAFSPRACAVRLSGPPYHGSVLWRAERHFLASARGSLPRAQRSVPGA